MFEWIPLLNLLLRHFGPEIKCKTSAFFGENSPNKKIVHTFTQWNESRIYHFYFIPPFQKLGCSIIGEHHFHPIPSPCHNSKPKPDPHMDPTSLATLPHSKATRVPNSLHELMLKIPRCWKFGLLETLTWREVLGNLIWSWKLFVSPLGRQLEPKKNPRGFAESAETIETLDPVAPQWQWPPRAARKTILAKRSKQTNNNATKFETKK